jgi:hypothetical protein
LKTQPIDFTPYFRRTAITPEERATLNLLIRERVELRSVSLWCYYNVRWQKPLLKARAA